ncbi:MAG: AI-2E family transporter [Candidatus Paceibacterota bacterium]|jgi:predicted PurR-regulated permease PerM
MKYQKTELYFLFALITIISILLFFVFEPFLFPLILAVIFATIFAPIHKKSLAITHKRPGFAAFLTTTFILFVIVVPVAFLITQIIKEASDLYLSIAGNGGVVTLSQGLEATIRNLGIPFLPAGPIDFSLYAQQGLNWFLQHIGPVFSNVAIIALDLFILLIALYFLLRDGDTLKKVIISISPLKDAYDEIVIQKLERAVNSVVRGSISVGLVQGALTAIGLAIFGVPNPILWGTVASIVALIPGIGTSLVLIPSILYLFFVGTTAAAVGLLVWGLVAVGLVDNILGPKLVGRGVQFHPFLILLSILGGVSFFGPIGFLLGPLTLSLLLAVLEIYALVQKERNE